MKAESFKNLLKRDNVEHIPKNDILLPELLNKMLEISYSMMIRFHAE
jgi:hypothetical protein